jgi:predicted ATPase
MIKDVEISNFRGFADLRLHGLGRVNLIVGRNNTGKTSLLEALQLLSDPGNPGHLDNMFRPNPRAVSDRFFVSLVRDGTPGGESRVFARIMNMAEWTVVIRIHPSNPIDGASFKAVLGHCTLDVLGPMPNLRVRAFSVDHRAPEDMVVAFAEAVRPIEAEAQMESLLRAVDPRVKTMRLDYAQGAPYIVVDVGLSARIPISQAGQGLYRLVGLFSELLGQRPQIALIDEVENGIHHTVLPEVWKGIAEVAERLNIQIFATTHSGECLAAAHAVFSERASYDLRVIQLYTLDDSVDGRVLDEAHIAAAVTGEIELR